MPKSRTNYPTVQPLTETEPGELIKKQLALIDLWEMPPIDTENPEEVRTRIKDYLSVCTSNGIRPGKAGLACALGVHRSTIWNWSRETGVRGDLIRHVNLLLESMWENWMQSGNINPVSGIFLGKNNFAYRDEQQLALARLDDIPRPIESAEQIAARYADAERPALDSEAPSKPPALPFDPLEGLSEPPGGLSEDG